LFEIAGTRAIDDCFQRAKMLQRTLFLYFGQDEGNTLFELLLSQYFVLKFNITSFSQQKKIEATDHRVDDVTPYPSTVHPHRRGSKRRRGRSSGIMSV
jgi:hypothetical protein